MGRTRTATEDLLARIEQTWLRRDLGQRLLVLSHPEARLASDWGMVSDPGEAELALLPLLQAMPDLSLMTEDLFPADGGVAARFLLSGRHDGEGPMGVPTGQAVWFRAGAAALLTGGRVAAAFVVQDQAALLAQIGIDACDYARHLVGDLPPAGPPDLELALPGGAAGQWGQVWGEIVQSLLTDGPATIDAQYDPACLLDAPGGIRAHGRRDVADHWVQLRAAFPSARLRVLQAIGREDRLMPPRASVLWRLEGRHDGWGAFGEPTGATVHVTGLSQAEFGPDGVRRDVVLYDPLAIWAQIHRHTGLGD
ncbi:nuclear transport factor 2 family protein [Pseudoprimorskyibacter insulae]|uniref:SnoaL-like domain-containing protein n=1 Tax=Pseudoprimorskyibacter insulae TaxID=1695997 RepID=A0A2R8AQQ0_9RHOB|nr:nuclear transport factor 2 family protein [Pseudoprimorskyibacter insulae]SPF78401.1 hypothetical protein PRI8871_01003 [Pseudoprimorskyibacter insulae]